MPEIDATVSRRTQAGIAIGGGVLALGAIGTAVYFGWKYLKPIADNAAGAAKNASDAVARFIGGAANVAEGAADVAEGVGDAVGDASRTYPDADNASRPTSPELPRLRIEVLSKERRFINARAYQKTTVKVRVVQDATGQPVGNAQIQAYLRSSNLTLHEKDTASRKSVTYSDYEGLASVSWEVYNPNGVNGGANDADLVAKRQGFNPSNKTLVD